MSFALFAGVVHMTHLCGGRNGWSAAERELVEPSAIFAPDGIPHIRQMVRGQTVIGSEGHVRWGFWNSELVRKFDYRSLNGMFAWRLFCMTSQMVCTSVGYNRSGSCNFPTIWKKKH